MPFCLQQRAPCINDANLTPRIANDCFRKQKSTYFCVKTRKTWIHFAINKKTKILLRHGHLSPVNTMSLLGFTHGCRKDSLHHSIFVVLVRCYYQETQLYFVLPQHTTRHLLMFSLRRTWYGTSFQPYGSRSAARMKWKQDGEIGIL